MLRYKGWLEDKPRAMYDQDMFEITGQSKKYFQWQEESIEYVISDSSTDDGGMKLHAYEMAGITFSDVRILENKFIAKGSYRFTYDWSHWTETTGPPETTLGGSRFEIHLQKENGNWKCLFFTDCEFNAIERAKNNTLTSGVLDVHQMIEEQNRSGLYLYVNPVGEQWGY